MRARRWGFWEIVAALIVVAFAGVAVLRFTRGLGAVTHLSDRFPWGVWIGFDVLCGVGLAAGAFTVTAITHVFHASRFEPIVRPTVLTGLLGYLLVIAALMFDLGQPWRIWHALVFWNPHSVMFEVAWCVILYTAVLLLEFAPVVFERLRLERPQRVLRAIGTPLVIAAVLLSTLHQSSLGSLYLIAPTKLYPLWYSPLLPFLFLLSAVAAGIAMVVIESALSERAFGRRLEMSVLEPLARGLLVTLVLYALLRLVQLRRSAALPLLLHPGYEEAMFLLEIALGILLPVAVLSAASARRSPRALTVCALLVVAGFLLNRLNVSVTGMERAAGVRYLPSAMELAVSVGLVAIGFVLFALAVRHLPIFPPAPVRDEIG